MQAAYLSLRSGGFGVIDRDIARLSRPMHALMVNGSLPLAQRTVDALLEYSSSLPSGTGEGKVWKRRGPGGWWLGRYGAPYPADHQHAGSVPIGWWPIYVEGQPAAFPRDVCVPAPVMRGRPIAYVPPPPELPEGLWESDGRLWFSCRSCDRTTEWEGEAADFDLGHYANVCGGSPRCLP